MASHRTANFEDRPYIDPNPLPSSVPHVDELGVTSAPLKSAAFAIGEYCKDVNGMSVFTRHPQSGRRAERYASEPARLSAEDFMLCKQENRDPAHCLKEGRKVTRCAADM